MTHFGWDILLVEICSRSPVIVVVRKLLKTASRISEIANICVIPYSNLSDRLLSSECEDIFTDFPAYFVSELWPIITSKSTTVVTASLLKALHVW